MSDQDPNLPPPPAPKPSWETPAAATPAEPAEVAPVTRPAWDGQPPDEEPPRRRRFIDREIDLKIVIAVLIGLASVTGAVMTWRSAQLGEFATDKDRQAIAETVLVAQANAEQEVSVQDARARFSEHAVAQVAANQLLLQVDQFASVGNTAAADAAREEAVEQQALADRALEGGPQRLFLVDYVVTGDDGAPTFAEDQFRTDLQDLREAESEVLPRQTLEEANRLRRESQHFVGWLIGVVAAVALFTLAQINRAKFVRLGLTGAGVCLWLVAAIVAFGGA